MKKRFLFFVVFLLAMTVVSEANPIDIQTAREVAVKFMNANTKTPLRGVDDLQLVTTYSISRGDVAFYVFNTPNGFVIVSADDCFTPILGYSYEGQFDVDNIPMPLQGFLQGFVEQIQYGIENHLEADETRARQWELVRNTGRLNDNRDGEGVEPLVTTMWDQGGPYSMFVPSGCLAGCTAIAMAQVMKYWEWPVQGTGEHSYSWNGQTLSANFGETTYDWDNMLDSYYNNQATQEQREAVGMLVWHCGVSVDMHYGTDWSGAWLYPSSLIDYFNYSDEMTRESRLDYSDATWKAKLKDCLDLGRPIHYSGIMTVGNHAVVCDGYDSNDLFHFNMGWGGGDSFVALETICPSRNDYAIFNIHPQSDVPTMYDINVSANNDEYGSVSGGGTFIHGDTVTLSVVANIGYCFHYWEENGGVASTDPNYSFPANFNRNLTAVFSDPVAINTSASEGGAVSDSGIYCYYEECEVTATPDEGYRFACWTENGNTVSIEASYSFIVTGERNLAAHFAEEGNIVFADPNVKAICLANWDYDNDGELSYAEALSVTDLGQIFKNKSNITSFDELQYFTNLTTINDQAFYQCNYLTSLTLPNSISSIGNSAFVRCTRLSSLNFPDTISSIGKSAFYNCTGLTSLTLPNAMTMISERTFYGCSGLTSVTLPDTISSIGKSAFYNCTGLTSVVFPNSLTAIDNDAFYGCSGLISVTFSNSLVTIGNYSFCGCTGLTSLTIPNSVASVSSGAFSGCSGLTSIVLPNSITSIESSTFYGCSNLTSLTIPNTVTLIDGYAFKNCSSLTSLTLSGSITSIGTDAFSGCSSLTSMTLPNSITSIGNDLFYGCSGLTSVTIPDSVVSIGSYAFYGCSSLTSLTIPNSVASIGSNVLYNCWNLTSLIVLAVTPPTAANNAFYNVNPNTPVFVPCESIAAYQAANRWSALSNIIGLCDTGTITLVADLPEGGEVIGAGTYEGGASCTVTATPNEGYYFVNWTENGKVVSSDASFNFIVTGDRALTARFALDGIIDFADTNVKAICVANWDTNGDGELSYSEANSVMSIGEMFRGHTEIISFEELQYFTNLSSICSNAFNGCSGLTSLVFPNAVTLIGASAFYGCSSLTGSLTLPDFITSIGNSAFYDCSGFTGSLTFPNTITTIAENAFYGCSGFTGLTLPDSLRSIGKSAFRYCSGFTGDLTIPDAVTSIGEYAFYCCSGFTGDLTIGNSVYSIGNYAFYFCYGMKGSLILSNSVTIIGDFAFYYCSGFTGGLDIPNSVRSIGEFAFCELQGLKGSLTIGNSVYSIGRFAFSGINNLKSIIVLKQQPPAILANSFEHQIPLYVPCESLESYQTATGWTDFSTIIGMCSPAMVSLTVEPAESGVVSGGGTYEGGTLCTLIATPNEGYYFANWTENGSLVSYDSTYCFIVTEDRTLTARFVSDENIVFADANVKDLCVAHWDINGDGELSYSEAASVTDLGEVFKGNTEITSFEELQYFIGLYSISDYAFLNCTNLTTVSIQNPIASIGNCAFENCRSLTGPLNIPNSVTSIGDSAFSGCYGLTSLSIPNSVKSIGYSAFSGCYGLTGSLTLPNSVTSIGGMTFFYCYNLTSLTIPNSVTYIGYEAFYYCYGLTGSLTLPNSVTFIGERAFCNCNGLTSLTIGDSVTSIGSYAFNSCSNLESVIMFSPSVPTLGSNAFSGTNANYFIYVPYASLNDYKTATNWSNYESRIQGWLQKSHFGYDNDNDGWAFIASPLVGSIDPSAIDNMVPETETSYDLYRFNQSTELEWENQKAFNNLEEPFLLVNGHGYLYASDEDVNFFFKGLFNENETEEISLIYDGSARLKGWNLVGNPFPVSAYANRSYYVMNETGTAIHPMAVSTETAIEPFTGIMVKANATESNPTVIFSKTTPISRGQSQGMIGFTISGNSLEGKAVEDNAIISFNEGDCLAKMVIDPNAPKLYIRHGEGDYAIAEVDKACKSLELCFSSKQPGDFTLTVDRNETEFEYLQLVDHVTGLTVDLLEQPTYVFHATGQEPDARFSIRFKVAE